MTSWGTGEHRVRRHLLQGCRAQGLRCALPSCRTVQGSLESWAGQGRVGLGPPHGQVTAPSLQEEGGTALVLPLTVLAGFSEMKRSFRSL